MSYKDKKRWTATEIYYLYKRCVEIPNSKDTKDIFFRAIIQVQRRRQ